MISRRNKDCANASFRLQIATFLIFICTCRPYIVQICVCAYRNFFECGCRDCLEHGLLLSRHVLDDAIGDLQKLWEEKGGEGATQLGALTHSSQLTVSLQQALTVPIQQGLVLV